MKALRHIITVTAAVGLMLLLPLVSSDGFRRFISGDTDAVTSASVEVDAPSGRFLVLINRDKHTGESLALWRDFFSGREVSYILEDITCTAAATDASGLEMARSFQSRLPENQMRLKTEDAALMLSKADWGKFDIIIMSAETAERYGAKSVYEDKNVEVTSVEGTE